MHHIDKVAFLVETNPYLLLHLQEINSYFFLGGNGTSTTSVSLLLQETTKLSSSKDDIKIDTFLITVLFFQEGINYFYVLLFCFVSVR
jgi:hypothetical protein